MTSTDEMIRAHPVPAVREGIAAAINACYDCAEICSICADACLAEPMVANLVHCIALNQNCATICGATGEVLTRQSAIEPSLLRAQLQACIEACRLCAVECEGHGANMEHCAVCAAACRRCERVCRDLLDQL